MAIYHLHVGIVSRKTGRSAVAAAAYRAGEKLRNERDGLTHDYTRKKGVVYSEIMLPENAPKEYQDRYTLWNAVEKAEKRIDAQTARDIDVALPVEFDRQEQIGIVREYVRDNFVSQGMCADFAIHDKADGNPHAHIMLTTREVSATGFGGKNRDWNDKSHLENWRESWANTCNEHLREKGIDERIDHRTLDAQGINREPTIHIGVAAKAMERAGRDSDRVSEYRAIIERNEELTPDATAEYMHELKQGYVILDKEINAIKQERTNLRHEMNALRHKAEEIEERAGQIHDMDIRLDELTAQRREMGIFKSKKAIDKQILKLEHSRDQARETLKRKFYIAPEESSAEIRRLEYKTKDMERIQERLQDKLSPLVAERDVFALEYQRQKLLVEISADGQKIQDRLLQLDNDSHLHESAQDRLARVQSERVLDIVTERNFREILKDIQPHQSWTLIKQRELESESEISRIYVHER